MRRPLDWTLVPVAAMVLTLGRLLVADDPPAAVEPRTAPIEAAPAAPPYAAVEVMSSTGSPFAYIREDGSQVFLPAANPADAAPQIEDALPRPTARG